jgi:CheY-like chemotaxis protein
MFKGTTKRLLIIDDFIYNIKAAQMLLESCGLEVIGETSAIKALEHLQKVQAQAQHYEVVLVDMNMPEMDGLVCTAKIRELVDCGQIQPLRIVQCTAYSSEIDKIKSLKAGAHAFVTKPLSYSGLYDALKPYYSL